ncbi:MAG: uridine kinase [Mycoplasmoidaceae bacterium]
MKNKLIIVAGCSASGKTTVASKIKNSFSKGKAQIICLDRFYKQSAKAMPKVAKTGNANFDHPNAFDWKLFEKCLTSLLNNKPTLIPVYDYTTHKRKEKWTLVKPTPIIILEGVLVLYDDFANGTAALKIYVDTSLDTCFKRRLQRDQKDRARTVASIREQWNESVLPMFKKYVKAQRWIADFILPWDKPNRTSLNYLITAIKQQLKD